MDNLVMFFGIVPGAHEKLATALARWPKAPINWL